MEFDSVTFAVKESDTVHVLVGVYVPLSLSVNASVTVGVLTGVRIFVSEGVSVALMLGNSAVIDFVALGSSEAVFD